jgi:hypothetical protein
MFWEKTWKKYWKNWGKLGEIGGNWGKLGKSQNFQEKSAFSEGS